MHWSIFREIASLKKCKSMGVDRFANADWGGQGSYSLKYRMTTVSEMVRLIINAHYADSTYDKIWAMADQGS